MSVYVCDPSLVRKISSAKLLPGNRNPWNVRSLSQYLSIQSRSHFVVVSCPKDTCCPQFRITEASVRHVTVLLKCCFPLWSEWLMKRCVFFLTFQDPESQFKNKLPCVITLAIRTVVFYYSGIKGIKKTPFFWHFIQTTTHTSFPMLSNTFVVLCGTYYTLQKSWN